ncbi:hypothetical protein GLAREA_02242 [Glarea lozoyensis ATCC 20868]|uniref:Uncharacterized protein n=1 Tax=Glarea lozoyensis (strain ATCC 20868 / MF5171) TaxID=1116229 RepID=S3CKR5_GLAL2|nr:uncharacterized protein GLAREA_02242 [Glarea lozoyensis ATCC 20868]EPE26330.1 hypothetical protein GLAREA_02242 [Glarea lozoyensis ATCC 20868]
MPTSRLLSALGKSKKNKKTENATKTSSETNPALQRSGKPEYIKYTINPTLEGHIHNEPYIHEDVRLRYDKTEDKIILEYTCSRTIQMQQHESPGHVVDPEKQKCRMCDQHLLKSDKDEIEAGRATAKFEEIADDGRRVDSWDGRDGSSEALIPRGTKDR